MPVKRLPPALVSRLRRIVKRRILFGRDLERGFTKLINIDHRYPRRRGDTISIVRKMNVSRTFPGAKVVIKKAHTFNDAKREIAFVLKRVREHNQKFKSDTYVLRRPIAYDLGGKFIAMAETNFPSLFEISQPTWPIKKETRGKRFFNDLKKKHGFTEKQFCQAAEQITKRTGILEQNMLLIGFKKGKFIFMPLMDCT